MPISTGLNSETVRVGLVLPEDNLTSIQLHPAGEVTFLEVPYPLPWHIEARDDELSLHHNRGEVRLDYLSLTTDAELSRIKTGTGIEIKSIVVGRGFHWQKKVPLVFPGKIEIAAQSGRLIVVNEVPLETYVACVATSELSSQAPQALLQAQTIVARCWALAFTEKKHQSLGIHFCNDDCCQRYQGTTYLTQHSLRAARETEGIILTYGNQVIDARYSKNCGGVVEASHNVWPNLKVPYMQIKWDGPPLRTDPEQCSFDEILAYADGWCGPKYLPPERYTEVLGAVDEHAEYYRWELELSEKEILANLKQYQNIAWNKINELRPIKRSSGGRVIELAITGTNQQGTEAEHILKGEYTIRQILSASFLYSAAFKITDTTHSGDERRFHLRGAGWGHGAGLCQMGALGMALMGYTSYEILGHYYTGSGFDQFP